MHRLQVRTGTVRAAERVEREGVVERAAPIAERVLGIESSCDEMAAAVVRAERAVRLVWGW